jgi:PAS domain S-box-containing protein
MKSLAHGVHFYEADPAAFIHSVGRYAWEGLTQDETVVLIATEAHREEVFRELSSFGLDPNAAVRDERLLYFDSAWVLSQITLNGQLQWELFEAALVPLVTGADPRRIRIYGDVAGLLWRTGRHAAAIQLEEFSNRFLSEHKLQLHCGYPINVFDPEFGSSQVRRVIALHTHIVPTGANGELSEALTRAVDEIIEQDIQADLAVTPDEAGIPEAEGLILTLRSRSNRANEILDRAREYYKQDRRFRLVVEHLSDGIALIDGNAIIAYASESAARVLGHERRHLLGTNSLDLVHSEDRMHVRRSLDAAIAGPGTSTKARARALRKDGGWVWMEVAFVNLLHKPEIDAVVLSFRDISAEVACEAETRRISNRLVQHRQERLQIAQAVLNNIMNPVRKMRTFGHLLAHDNQAGSPKQFAQHVEENAKTVSDLLSDLILLMGLDGDFVTQNTHLGPTAKTAATKLDRLIQETDSVVEIGELPIANVNESQFEALFQSLIENAIKFRGTDPARIELSSYRLGADWIITVQDNGIGIPENYREFVFGVFARLPNLGIAGRGLGLALCKKIVESAGGRIWADANPTGGTVICFAIPAVDQRPDGFAPNGI